MRTLLLLLTTLLPLGACTGQAGDDDIATLEPGKDDGNSVWTTLTFTRDGERLSKRSYTCDAPDRCHVHTAIRVVADPEVIDKLRRRAEANPAAFPFVASIHQLCIDRDGELIEPDWNTEAGHVLFGRSQELEWRFTTGESQVISVDAPVQCQVRVQLWDWVFDEAGVDAITVETVAVVDGRS
jgi:hypothetical protein